MLSVIEKKPEETALKIIVAYATILCYHIQQR